MIQLTDKHFAVEVPCGANSFRIQCHDEVFIETYIPTLVFFLEQTKAELDGELLSPGSWQFLFTTKEATEEDARKVVGDGPYGNYIPQNLLDKYHRCWLPTAKESLQSLLKAKGCDVSKSWAIIERL